MPHTRDVLIHLMARKLSAFTRLRPLRHLDLNIIGIDQIFRRHAKAAGRHLLDGGTHGIAIRHGREAIRFLTAFAGIGTPADAVHGDGKRGMRFPADGTKAHRTSREALHDLMRRFNFLKRDRLFSEFEFQQPADRQQTTALIVDGLGEILVAIR